MQRLVYSRQPKYKMQRALQAEKQLNAKDSVMRKPKPRGNEAT